MQSDRQASRSAILSKCDPNVLDSQMKHFRQSIRNYEDKLTKAGGQATVSRTVSEDQFLQKRNQELEQTVQVLHEKKQELEQTVQALQEKIRQLEQRALQAEARTVKAEASLAQFRVVQTPQATASPARVVEAAVTIQSAFRGHLERSSLEQERRLSLLPIGSPSRASPSRVDTQTALASPRRSLLPSSTADRSEQGASLSVGPLVGAAAAAMLGTEPAPVARKIAFMEHSETVEESKLDTSSAGETKAEEPAAKPAAAIAPKITPKAPLISVRDMQSKMKGFKKVLSNTEASWTLRQAAMNDLEAMVREQHAHMHSAFSTELDGMRVALNAQISDLRSSIVRECCRLLVALAECMGADFEDTLLAVVPSMLKNLFVTIKIISSSCDEAIRTMLQHCPSLKCLQMLTSYAVDSHAIVRRRTCEYIALLLAQPLSPSATGNLSDQASSEKENTLGWLIRKTICDGDKDVRVAARALFVGVKRKFPDSANVLWQSFDAAVQKAINVDSGVQTARPTTGAAGPKRFREAAARTTGAANAVGGMSFVV